MFTQHEASDGHISDTVTFLLKKKRGFVVFLSCLF